MASSQVEIASSSPFGCVLRDRNQHNGYRTRDSNAFQKNFNDLVQNHLNSCRNAGSGSLANENSIDFADLWVHHPQANNENNHHSHEPVQARISDRSNSNENSHQHIDYTDLWVHNPQRNNDENNQKKTNSGGNSERARDTVLADEKKSENSVSSGPLANSQRGRSQDGASSQPVSRVRSPESSRPVSERRRRSVEGVSSGPATTSQKGKRQNEMSSSPVLTSQMDSSVEVPNLGAVSSLLQKWRNFEGKRSSLVCSSKSNSGTLLADNPSFVEAPSRGSDACDESVDIRPDTPATSEESNGDWETVRTGLSGSPSSRGRDSDATENERIRVADIIKRLSTNSEEHNDLEQAVWHESLPLVRTSVDQSEQRPFSPVSSSPRIRGRQAFNDFQTQIERERHEELEGLVGCKAVSKFSHRGRIQAVLRVRFLLRGAEVKYGQHPNCTSSDSNGLKQSAIMHLREIFSLGAKHCASDLRSLQGEVVDNNIASNSSRQRKENTKQKLTEPTNPSTVATDTRVDAEGSFRSNSVEQDINPHERNNMMEQSADEVQSSKRKENHQPEHPLLANPHTTVSKGSAVQGDINHLDSNSTVHNSTLQVQNLEDLVQEASSSSDDIQKQSSSDSGNHGKPEFPVTETSLECTEGNLYSEFREANNQQLAGNGNELINGISAAQGDWQEEEDNNHQLDCSWSDQLSGLEELESDYQQEVEINHDWINDVSRPRTTWEDLRQARYREMLDPFLENDEIRHLLERKSVSSFLSSGMRERIDRLMMSRTQQISRTDQLEGGTQEERRKEAKGGGEEGEYEQHNEEEEEDGVDYGDDYEEDQENEIQSGKHNAAKSCIDHTTSWVHSQDHEVSDNYSDQAASPYLQQSPLSNLSTLESQRSMNHYSIEMELICELKGNVEQLHQEISELRRSIKSCVNMQMELQQSIKQQITAALCQSGEKKRRDSSRGRCCICYEMPIDSLLYRCGHMCTCFNCAHELQWGSGKCPVCRAPIIDVVRAYAHS